MSNVYARFYVRCAMLLGFMMLDAFACNVAINIHSGDKAPLSKIIEEVASQCHLSVIYTQEGTKALLDSKKSVIHIRNKPLKTVLDSLIVSNDFYYTLQTDAIKIGFLLTKTFEVNYIATTRVGSSNTDIVFSQDNQIYNLYNAYNTQNQFQALSNFDLSSQAHKMAIGKATSNTQNLGKSGTKIYSIDEIDFWGELYQEIANVAYVNGDLYQPQDTESKDKKHIIINKAAGLLTITATSSQMARVEEYIKNLNEKIAKQVLINVHILNISHTNNQTYGVDWNELYKLGELSTMPPSATTQSSSGVISSSGNAYALNVFSQGVSLNRILEFLQTYGKVQSISNPKVLTLNNQPAIISVGSVLRYSQNTTYQTTTQGTSIQNNAQAFPSVFAGILLDVTPSIKADSIILKINPSITKTKDVSVENQTTALSSPPNLSTKQLSSLVQLKDGERIILGGLIDKTEGQVERKVPLLGDIPIIKYLFSYKKRTKETQEMVIIIEPHIVRNDIKFVEQFKGQFDETFKQVDNLLVSDTFINSSIIPQKDTKQNNIQQFNNEQ